MFEVVVIFFEFFDLWFLAILDELFVSFTEFESDIFDDLPIANRAKLQRFIVILLNAVETIHEAIIVDTVSDSKHVTDLVHHCSEWGVQDLVPVNFRFLVASKVLVPPDEWEDADSGFVLGPSVDVVPTVTRVNIFQGDAHDAVRIFGNSFLHIGKDILS